MEINAQFDVDVVALQAEDEVTCLLTLTAPTPPQAADRPGETLIVVVDRSGSMQGEPLQSVRTARSPVSLTSEAFNGRPNLT